jgi:uncharacterized protein YggE
MEESMNRRYLITTALIFAAAGQLSAQQEARREPRVLSVNGTGTVQRQPDRAIVLVAVESRAPNAQVAAQTNAQKMETVYAALRRLGITPPKVQTISYELHPEYGRPDPRAENPDAPRVTGYVATNMVRVQVDSIVRVGSVIDAAIAAGANRIANLSFELRDPESARLEALRIAVQKARAEAEAVAAAAGQKLGPPQSISSSSGWQPQPMYRAVAMEAMAQAPAPTPIESGNLSIVANVSITYLLEDR